MLCTPNKTMTCISTVPAIGHSRNNNYMRLFHMIQVMYALILYNNIIIMSILYEMWILHVISVYRRWNNLIPKKCMPHSNSSYLHHTLVRSIKLFFLWNFWEADTFSSIIYHSTLQDSLMQPNFMQQAWFVSDYLIHFSLRWLVVVVTTLAP